MTDDKPTYKDLEQRILILEHELHVKNENLSLLKSKFDEKERSIREITSNFETFFNTINDFLFVLNEEGDILHCNKAVEKRLGYTLEELRGKSVLSVHPEERRNEVAQIVADMIAGNVEFCSIPLITKQGKQINVETSVNRGIWNGKPVLFRISKDLTNLKLSEEKFSAVFYLNPSVCGLSEADTGKYIEVNDAFHRLLGFTREETIGHTVIELQIMSAEDRAAILSKADSLGRIHNAEAELRTKNGDIKRVLLSSQYINIQDITYRYTVVHDVTDIHKAKEIAEENEKKFSKLFNNCPEPLSVSSLDDGRFIMVNDAFVKISGFERAEVINRTSIDIKALLSIEDRERWLNELINNGSVRSIEIQLRTKKLGIRNFLISSDIIELDKKKCAINFYIDITDRKNAEIELLKAKEKAEESDKLKTAFLQNMSHEIRTPLNAICGFSELLSKDNLSEDKRKNFVQIVQNNSSQLLAIVSDILTISSLETKQEKINISNVCINSIIVELLTIFKLQARNHNIMLYEKKQLSDKQSEIYSDRTKITQILSNLLSNSLKFTHKGSIEFGYQLIANELEFYVKDSGIGIKPELYGKIFDRFRQADATIQTNYGGTGLGLSICKGFVELLGGRIWVESEIEKGSTFYFTLPYKPVNETVKNSLINNLYENYGTILVAEDDEYNFLFIEEASVHLHLKIIHAKNGKEAVEMFKSNPQIDLVLMDIRMPVINGHDAAKIIRSIKPEIPIVAQTAYAMECERAKYEGIFDNYLTKPIKEEILIEMISKYFVIKQKEQSV